MAWNDQGVSLISVQNVQLQLGKFIPLGRTVSQQAILDSVQTLFDRGIAQQASMGGADLVAKLMTDLSINCSRGLVVRA